MMEWKFLVLAIFLVALTEVRCGDDIVTMIDRGHNSINVHGPRRRVQEGSGPNPESLLIKELLDGYNPLARPILNVSEPVEVDLEFALINIVDVDHRTGMVTLRGWTRSVWKDAYLQWTPKEHADIQTLSLPAAKTWNPDLVLFNSVEQKTEDVLNVVLAGGFVMGIVPVTYKVQCQVHDPESRPEVRVMDCELKFGSWTHSSSLVQQTSLGMWTGNYVDTTYLVDSPMCSLAKAEGRLEEKTYGEDPTIYQTMVVDLEIHTRH